MSSLPSPSPLPLTIAPGLNPAIVPPTPLRPASPLDEGLPATVASIGNTPLLPLRRLAAIWGCRRRSNSG